MEGQAEFQTDKIRFLVGDAEGLENRKRIQTLPVFSDVMVNFLDALSKQLRRDARTKQLPDVQAYAFWIRKASLAHEKQRHRNLDRRMGRGIAFHIAPSNVPVNFAVSMTSALLAGNACVIRVSNKDFLQVTVICDAINALLTGEFRDLKNYLFIVRYEHDDEITQNFCNLCDIRIIWGGNETIARIRRAKLPPRAIELAFADRYSVALIQAEEYLKRDVRDVAKAFYTDTYYSDQNACSSPRLVIWFGEPDVVLQAKECFWTTLLELAKQDYALKPIQAIDKWDAFCRLAARAASISDTLKVKLTARDNALFRIAVSELHEEILAYKNAGGFFFEYDAAELQEMIPILGKACQTICVLGLDTERIAEFVTGAGVRGVDRIVEMGKTMELSFQWDGYDMIETMSRLVAY